MTRAWHMAKKVMTEYYASRGSEWPEVAAAELLDRVHINRSTLQWENRDLVPAARAVLHDACFNVDDLAENFLHLTLHIENLEYLDCKAGASVLGCARPRERTITVCERTLAYEPLYRATVMHEIAHVLLHANESHRTAAYAPFSRRRPSYEMEADEFMACALLPRQVLILAVAQSADAWRLDLTEAFAGANWGRGRWQWQHHHFLRILTDLCVSRHLTAVAMRKLGYFSQNTLDHHLSYALPNKWLKQDGTIQMPKSKTIGSMMTSLTHRICPQKFVTDAVCDNVWH